MNADDWKRIRSLFEVAAEQPADQQAAYLDEACGEDAALRTAVEDLLRAEGCFDSLVSEIDLSIDEPTEPMSPPSEEEETRAEGMRVGGYRLVRLLARGGMGSVYEARGDKPRRTVALKMLRPGIGGADALRRFQHECDILARLEHEGIARVYEAGVVLPEGVPDPVEVPWFAMEFVEDARSIVAHAREEQLSLAERLTLFREACQAIHHGHLHGVIHRDLKPANLLVGRDGRPRVIDFGIARITDDDPELTCMLTQTGEVMGTVQYMSPEQFSGDNRAIDVRTDVYSMGVVLFELLCDRLPYDLSTSSLFEIARIVQKEPPSLPRDVEPELPAEMDWIVARALAKNPEQRYDSLLELEGDVRRFLEHEPLLVGPPGAGYRIEKFARRHRAGVTAAGLLLLILIGGLLGTTYGLVQAERKRAEAETQSRRLSAVNDFLTELFRSANPEGNHGRDVKVADILDRAVLGLEASVGQEPEIELSLREALFAGYHGLGLPAESGQQLDRLLELLARLHPEDHDRRLEYLRQRVYWLIRTGEAAQAEQQARALLREVDQRLGETHLLAVTARRELGSALYMQGKIAEAADQFEATLELAKKHYDPESTQVVELRIRLADALAKSQQIGGAEAELKQVVESLESRGTVNAVLYLSAISTLGDLLLQNGPGRLDEAADCFERAYQVSLDIHGEEHGDTVQMLMRLARIDMFRDDNLAAELKLRETLDLYRRMGMESFEVSVASVMLAGVLQRQGNLEGAGLILEEQVEFQGRLFGLDDPRTLSAEGQLAGILADRGEHAQAAARFESILERMPRRADYLVEESLWSLATATERLRDPNDPERVLSLLSRQLEVSTSIFGDRTAPVGRTLAAQIAVLESLHPADHPRRAEAQALRDRLRSWQQSD